MTEVPHITIYQKHINSAVSAIDRYPCSMVEVCNKAIEIALAEANAEPTCQVRNDDTGKTETMTREAAKKLQAETKNVCDWFIPNATLSANETLKFLFNGIYTYKLKATVKLTIDDEPVKMLTPAQCEAERLARVDTHDLRFKMSFENAKGFSNVAVSHKPWVPVSDQGEYQLRAKPLKQGSWTGSREDVIALLTELGFINAGDI